MLASPKEAALRALTVDRPPEMEAVTALSAIADELRELRAFFENQANDGQARPLTEVEAAEYCRVEVKTLRYYSNRLQEIPFIKVGRERLYLREDLEGFLRSKRVGAIRKVR